MHPVPAHRYDLTPREAARVARPYLIGALLVAGSIQLAARLDLLPEPTPGDLDRTLLATKVRLARDIAASDVVLLGDSSCMMDADAQSLARHLERPVLNLGTLSFLEIADHAALLRYHLQHRSQPPAIVVLLLHPEALRRASPVADHHAYLRSLLEGTPQFPADWLGGRILREQAFQAVLPVPLPGPFGTAYGCNSFLSRIIERQRGSLRDPTSLRPGDLLGSPEYRLARSLELGSRDLRSSLPPSSMLLAGITPVPASFAAPDHPARIQTMLRVWGGWLKADGLLDGLPAVLPDDRFANLTHLNARGSEEFTDRLAALIAPRLMRFVEP